MKTLWYRALVPVANTIQPWLVARPALYKVLLMPHFSGFRARLGVWRAWVNTERTYQQVPAYRQFVDAHGGRPQLRLVNGVPDLTVWPETDKASYVQQYRQASRCVGGTVPAAGVSVDESSGSSGRPTSWVRGPQERAVTTAMMRLSFQTALGDKPQFVLNAFSLGAWATGMNVTQSLTDICTMKSTGPDIDKLVSTLQEFGPDYDYVVCGYPPFLKSLADDPRIDWAAYRVRAIFGGEAMSEAMRSYLLRSFTQVVGSYGASDLEINLAAESPFTIALRQELQRNASLQRRLCRDDMGVLPMVLQYNPLAYVFETNDAGELVVTMTRPTTIAPKPRYNIHDVGHAVPFNELATILRDAGCGHLIDEIAPVHLPVLFLYGRSDQSVDYYGANVTPDGVSDVLFQIDHLAPHLAGFQLLSLEDEWCNKTMEVALELNSEFDVHRLDELALADEVFARLASVNGDFRNAYRNTATRDRLPRLSLHARGTGPFAHGDDSIKRRYVSITPRVAASSV